ncbi:hypothetical protein F4779DRAFT_505227 [Xylariaceae sp. FL0662B]|nr:hypothetical protein F4779DRAFT_505227 [Xylariaceae sp. FL0662B]
MPKSVKSPSDFIYRGSSSSLESPVCDSSVMEPMESRAPEKPSNCRQDSSLWSTDTHRKEYYAAVPVSNTTPRLVTSPNAQFSSEDKLRQPGLPYEHQVTTPPSLGLPRPPEMAIPNDLENKRTHLPPTNVDNPYTADAALGHQNPIQNYATRPDRQLSTTPSATEDQTISVHSSHSEQAHRIYTIVHAVHNICLQSTKTYLNTHLANHRARASDSPPPPPPFSPSTTSEDRQPSSPRCQSSPDSSNVNLNNCNNHRRQRVERNPPFSVLPTIPASTNSLLKNISGICGMLWAGSQRDRLDVLNVERLAVETMGRLLTWAETVVLGDYDEWVVAEEEALWRIGKQHPYHDYPFSLFTSVCVYIYFETCPKTPTVPRNCLARVDTNYWYCS